MANLYETWEETQVKVGGHKLSFWDVLKTPFMKYAQAAKVENLLKDQAADPNNPYQKGDAIKKWFTEFWYVPVILVILLFKIIKKILK